MQEEELKFAYSPHALFAGSYNLSFLKDRLRMGLGARDFSDFDNTWFLTFSIMDLPGAAYWLTRWVTDEAGL